MFGTLIRRFSMRFSVTLNRSAISRTVYPDNSKTIVSASRAVKRSTPAICCPLSKSGGAGWWCTLSVRGSAAPPVVLWRGRGGLVVFAPVVSTLILYMNIDRFCNMGLYTKIDRFCCAICLFSCTYPQGVYPVRHSRKGATVGRWFNLPFSGKGKLTGPGRGQTGPGSIPLFAPDRCSRFHFFLPTKFGAVHNPAHIFLVDMCIYIDIFFWYT